MAKVVQGGSVNRNSNPSKSQTPRACVTKDIGTHREGKTDKVTFKKR